MLLGALAPLSARRGCYRTSPIFPRVLLVFKACSFMKSLYMTCHKVWEPFEDVCPSESRTRGGHSRTSLIFARAFLVLKASIFMKSW